MSPARWTVVIVSSVACFYSVADALQFGEPMQVPLGEEPWTMDAGLLVGDGRTDVVVGTVDGPLILLEGKPFGAGLSPVWSFPGSYPKANVAVGDFDGDGDGDVVATYEVFEGDSLVVFTQESDGSFRKNQGLLERFLEELTAADVDHDGDHDLVGAAPDSVVVYLGGPSLFEVRVAYDADIQGSCASASIATSFDVRDVTEDGHLDITLTAHSSGCHLNLHGVGVLAGDGNGEFDPVDWVYVEGMYVHQFYSSRVADTNGDDVPDITVSAGDSVRVLLGTGAGAWVRGPAFVPGPALRDFLLRDFDGDSDVDIVGGWGQWSTTAVGFGDGTFQPGATINAGLANVQLLQLDLEGSEGIAGLDYDGFVTVMPNLPHLDPASAPPTPLDGFSLSVQSPARGALHLDIESLGGTWLACQIYDASGRILYGDRIWVDPGVNSLSLEANLGVTGLKFLRVEDSSGADVTRKFLWTRH